MNAQNYRGIKGKSNMHWLFRRLHLFQVNLHIVKIVRSANFSSEGTAYLMLRITIL